MSQLVLVRHGQAAFMTDDYDRLTPLGEQQARLLGEFWVRTGISFDRVFTGSLLRQRRTAELVAEVMADAGIEWQEFTVLPEFNEYDGDGIVEHLLPILKTGDDRFRILEERYRTSESPMDRRRHFQKMFEAVTARWISGEVQHADVESFRAFHDRVTRGISAATAPEAAGQRIAVFSSGGAISVAIQLAAGAPVEKVLEFNWRIRNCSISEVVFTRARFSLDVFNAIPHLGDPGLHTYR